MTQRSYSAACPNCGAPVEFKSAASRLAVCGFCRSSLSRDGETLARIGQMAELFDDHSPLQLGVQGRVPDNISFNRIIAHAARAAANADGAAGIVKGSAEHLAPLTGGFSLVGRLQYRYADGVWNEWHLLFDAGQRAWLSEDNGSYALSCDIGERVGLPNPEKLQAGQTFRLDGRPYQIASVTQAQLIAAAGELPYAAPLNQPFWLVEARSADGTIATLDYSATPVTANPASATAALRARIYLGIAAPLAALTLSGLKEPGGKTLKASGLSCPNCGTAVEVKLPNSKSVTCGSCASVVDLTQTADGKPAFTQQSQRYQSPIPLGTVGKVDGIDWQAVGFARRSGVDNEGERFSWGEVLLYNRIEGFAFVVVASDAVSLVRPVQDVPSGPAWTSVRYRDRQYSGEPNYQSVVDYVEGEFYWQVRIGQPMRNVDYRSGDLVLSREESLSKDAREVVWSHGKTYPPAELAKAFGLPDISQLPFGGGSGRINPDQLTDGSLAGSSPGAAGSLAGGGLGTAASAANAAPTSGSVAIWIIIFLVIVMIVIFISMADRGGGYGGGGYSGSGRGYSGGSHK